MARILASFALLFCVAASHAQPKATTTSETTARKASATTAKTGSTGAQSATTLTPEQEQAIKDSAKTVAGLAVGTFIVFVVVTFLIQLVPIGIALIRNHPSKLAIIVIAIVFGWTCIGWWVAFIWSLTGVPAARVDHYYHDDDDRRPRRRR